MIPLLGLLLGLCTYFIPFEIHTNWASYLSLAVLAAMDSVVGGIKANIEGKFNEELFFSSFIFNTLIAAFLAFLGDKVGINLFLAALIALGGRMFLNISIIRNLLMQKIKNKK
ncbi:MAG: small basic family protein [Armatimonadetes bacterium]|nr:small basic family protein [Candidatus Hippobium faecium]